MTLSSLERVEKLKRVDEIIFNLKPELPQDKEFSVVGEILIELGMITDNNKQEIIHAYKTDIGQRLQRYLESTKEEENKVILHEDVLQYYEALGKGDLEIAEIVQACRQDFIKYSCIVLSFDNQINALRETKQNDEYREAAKFIDHKRTEVHNNCLANLRIINRISKLERKNPFIETSIVSPTRTDYGAAVVKLCYNKMINTLTSII